MLNYNLRPTYRLTAGKLSDGYQALAGIISSSSVKLWLVDGITGVDWGTFRRELQTALNPDRISFIDISTVRIGDDACKQLLHEYLDTGDPNYGRIYPGELGDFFDPDKMLSLEGKIQQKIDRGDLVLVYGVGSSLLDLRGEKAWVDLPKEKVRQLITEGKVSSPATWGLATMKIISCIDWPVLDRHIAQLLPAIDLFIDFNDPHNPVFINGSALRQNIHDLSQHPFRVNSLVSPARWGGQWVVNNIKLPQKYPNCGQFYMLYPRKNALIFHDNNLEIEVPFELVLTLESVNLLGPLVAEDFGAKFPVHFNLLDTIGGGNLSVQVHPQEEKACKQFNTKFPENESYYILDTGTDSRIYLGFRDDVDPEQFSRAVTLAQDEGVPFEETDYVNSCPSRRHDVFSIPAGTIHNTGANNLLLEISTAQNLHTFRLYDYLRCTDDGKQRSVQAEKGLQLLDFSQRSEWVNNQAIETPKLIRQGEDWAEYKVISAPWYPFEVHRVDFTGEFTDDTKSQTFHMLMLIEGEEIVIESNVFKHPLHNIEIILIPAAIGQYKLINRSQTICTVLKTRMNYCYIYKGDS